MRAFSIICIVVFFITLTARASVQIVRVPEGGLQPQVLTDAHGCAHMIYFKGDPSHGDVFYVRSDDGGATFTPPMQVNSEAGSVIAIGTVRGPHLALGKNGRPHVAWMGSALAQPKIDGKPPMLYTRLNDAGKGFEPQRNVIQKYPGLDGGGAVAADGQGNVYVAWHSPEHAGKEADRRVWLARSTDDGQTFAPETAVLPATTGACGCCGMNIATDAKGAVYVLFRTATETVHRDMQLLVSNDRGGEFKVVANDPWNVGACVMSTAAFGAGPQEMVAAWETQGQIKVSRSNEAGKVLSIPGRAANRKHPAVAVNSRGEYLVTWAENTGWNKGGSVAWQVFDAAGNAKASESGRAEGLPAWDSPAVFVTADDGFKVVY